MATITGTAGNDRLNGTNGGDTIRGLAGIDELYGRGGNDTLDGGDGFDTIIGGDGNDTVINGTGEGYLDGGAGTDWVTFYDNDADGGIYSLMSGQAKLAASSPYFTMVGFENIGTGSGHDGIYGTNGKNIVDSGHGNDVIYGFGGNDTLRGSYGNDVIYGDNGNDLIDGGAGSDTLFGGAGNDTFLGVGGNVTIEGNAGSDSIDGGTGFDTLDYRSNLWSISADVPERAVYEDGFANIHVIASIEKIIGSRYNDELIAGATTQLDGFSGNDLLYSGSGANKLTGGAGDDVLSYYYSPSAVTVNLGSGKVSGGWAQGDKIAGFEDVQGSAFADTLTGSSRSDGIDGGDGNDRIDGGGGGDWLYGGGGNDQIRGGGGNDVIVGNAGADTLWGGSGADRFLYLGASDSPAMAGQMDLIRDFNRGQGDKFDFGEFTVPLSFIGKAGFTAAGQVRFLQSGGNTIVEVNTAGSSGAEMAIQLTGNINLQTSDFIL